jgi:hypothetical protein
VFLHGLDGSDFLEMQFSFSSLAALGIASIHLLLSDPQRPDADGNPSVIRVIDPGTLIVAAASTPRSVEADGGGTTLMEGGVTPNGSRVRADIRGLNSREPAGRRWQVALALATILPDELRLMSYRGFNRQRRYSWCR